MHCSLPPHALVVHLAAVQHRARRLKPDVTVSLTYELTKSVSTTLHKIPAPARTIKLRFVPQTNSWSIGLQWTGQDV